MPGGRLPPGLIRAAVQTALTLRYGAGDWISGGSDQSIYLNRRVEMEKRLDLEEVEKTAEQAVLVMPHVFRVYTRARLLRGEVPLDPVGRAVLHSFNVQRSPDLAVLLEPYWLLAARGTTHGSAFGYDEQVPIVFMRPGIHAGRFYEPALVNDIEPTLASILEITAPSGSAGRVLAEILK
jgi:hypothetical protein